MNELIVNIMNYYKCDKELAEIIYKSAEKDNDLKALVSKVKGC